MSTAVSAPSVGAAPDGRLELASTDAIEGSPLYNEDLAPVPLARRTWTTYNFAALWIGMAHNVATWTLAAGLIALGMNWLQAIITIALANALVLVPMVLNGHAGTKYGIPFPVFARAAYGTVGANFPAVLRGLVACGWFGIQTWIGGSAIFALFGVLAGEGWTNASQIGGYAWTQWLSFFLFWALNMLIIVRGMETIRRFENWAAPFVLVVATFLLVWMLIEAGGFGPILAQESELGWGSDFWPIFFPSLMAMIAFWATLSLNIPDFTRFGGSQRSQFMGQALGLPTTMTIFPLMAIITTSASAEVYGEPIWDPVALLTRFDTPVVVVLSLFSILVATLSANVAANVVSPSNDFSNLAPRKISFRTAGILTGIIGVVMQPWRLLADPDVYIFTWLEFYGGMLGAVAGVLVAEYWLLRRTRLDLGDLYRPEGRYRYASGWNWRALVATIAGMVLAVGGAWSAPDAGPFPQDGLIPLFKDLYRYSWAVGIGVGLGLHVLLTRLFPPERALAEPAVGAQA